MIPERDDIFSEAREISDAAQRSQFVAQACGEDAALRLEVETMLQDAERADAFFEINEAKSPLRVSSETPGTVIGHYKLMEKIGEGGMGVVYMAEQREPVRRKVALKIIKAGMDTRQVVARFEAERQALALMDHPHIAKVLDGGETEHGGPYFVMELVQGLPITQFCDEARLSTRERLGLFLEVCSAIQHAHQKGIIHRDIKPTNILVTLHEEKPVPRVIDFGIAKATQQPLTDKTLFTQFQHLLGTPAYMSPEQAGLSGLDIDTRSDIYGLGVLLYELLTGTTPFDGKELLKSGLDEMRRTIREKEPPRPSTRISALGREDLTTTAALRKVEPSKLIHSLRGDLDWVVMKCLEKDRARRYDTATGLAADIRRQLNNEVVVARPPSAGYRFQKLVRRNKVAFAGAAAVAVVLIVGTVVSSWQAIRATAAEKRAREKAAAEVTARQSEAQQLARAERALEGARIEEGKAWLERAQSYLEEKNPFYAKLMAGRAIGFQGFGRDKLTDAQRLSLPQLLPPGSADAKAAEQILRSGEDCAPIWHGPIHTNSRGMLSSSLARCPVFTPDGRLLAARCGPRKGLGLWDLTTGTLKSAMEGKFGEFGEAMAVVISPDGRFLATARYGTNTPLQIWDVATQTNVLSLAQHPSGVLAFSPDGRWLASESNTTNKICLLEVPSGRMEAELGLGSLSGSYWSVAFSPDGAVLALGGWHGTVELWDLANRRLKKAWKAHAGHVRVAFSPDGRFLATGSYDKSAQLWKLPGGDHFKDLPGHSSGIVGVQFSPDGRTLATEDMLAVVRLWELPRGDLKATLRPSTVGVPDQGTVAFSPDASLLATGGFVNQLWELPDDRVEAELPGSYTIPAGRLVALSRNRTFLASATEAHVVELWEVASGQPRPGRLLHPDTVTAIALSPDGRWLASGDRVGIVRLWDSANARLAAEWSDHNSDITAVAFSPDGALLASCSRFDGTARLWDVAQRKAREQAPVLVHGEDIHSLAFDPQGRRLATAGNYPRGFGIKLWDVATGQPKGFSMLTNASVFGVAFSPDGRWLAAGTDHGNVRLLDAESGQLTAELAGHPGRIQNLGFSDDGRFLVGGGRDSSSVAWEVAHTNLLFRREVGGLWNIEAALTRTLDYGRFLNWFDLEGRVVTWQFADRGDPRLRASASPDSLTATPMKSFNGNSLLAVLQRGLSEDELERTLFRRFLRAGNLSSASLIRERHGPTGWEKESASLGLAYLREAERVLEWEAYLLAAQHAVRARTWLPARAAASWHLTALAERGLKHASESVAAIEKAIALENSNPDFWYDKALILAEQNQTPAARETLTQAIELARKADEKDLRLANWRKQLEQLGL